MTRSVFKIVWAKDPGKEPVPVCITADVVSETFNGWMKLRYPDGKEFNARLSSDGWRCSMSVAWSIEIQHEARRYHMHSLMEGKFKENGDPQEHITKIDLMVRKALVDMFDAGHLVATLEQRRQEAR